MLQKKRKGVISLSKKNKRPFRPADKVSRLTFTEEERADSVLEKPLKKAEKTADKLEKSHEKIPKKKISRKERTFDATTGQAKVRLHFEETNKPKPASPLSHRVKAVPQRELLNKIHKEIREGEQDNVGVEAAHKTEQGAEFGTRLAGDAYRSHKLKPYRQLARAEKQTVRAEINYLYQKNLKDSPVTNPLSRWQQKREIKKQYLANRYAKGAEKAHQTVKNTKGMANTVEKLKQLVSSNKRGILLFLCIGAVLMLLLSSISSCSVLLEGGLQNIVATSYTSEDEDIAAVDEDYTLLERALQERINNIESEYPGYDEYQYNLNEIGHIPFTLASYLTAKVQTYTRASVQAELRALFDKQYTLIVREEVQVRYRTERRTGSYTDSEGNRHSYSYTVQVPYDYYILHVTLKNKDISVIAEGSLTEEQYKMFAVYMETQGNKPYLFEGNIYAPTKGEYTDYDIPPNALTDPAFASLIKEAEKYLGFPYVWGGSSPSTSFDCSGFVTWVLRESGVYNISRTTAQGIFNQSAKIPPSEARPGDIIFFTGTYASTGAVSHVGIYVGDGMMIHCGNPIQYASVNSTYWKDHFYAYGRLN